MIPDALVLLAGFVLAHAAWSVSDLPKGERLIPLAIVEKGGQRQLLRFEAPTQEQAIAEGKTALARRQADADAWSFAREGVMTEKAGRVDILTIDAWAKGMVRPVSFVQRFSPYASGAFRIREDALVIVDGKALEGAEAARLVQRLYDGAQQHPRIGQLWQGWRAK
jgi:hypothetical protein